MTGEQRALNGSSRGARRWANVAVRIVVVSHTIVLCTWGQGSSSVGCNDCHDVAQQMAGRAHAGVACTTCHVRHEEVPHPENIPKPVCANCHSRIAADQQRGIHGQEARKGNSAAPECNTCHGLAHQVQITQSAPFRTSVPEICGACHSEVASQFQASVHGRAVARGVPQAPVCTDCHGEHAILPPRSAASPVSRTNVRETCGSCHGDVRLARKFGFPADRLVSFDSSYHGLAARAGSQTVANCASCHGIHNILPSSDPRSMINAKNLPATCGRCHPGAGRRFAITSVHLDGSTEPVAVRLVRRIYLWAIPLIVGLMFAHNAGDWVRKLYRLRLTRTPVETIPADTPPRFRMFAFERLQHALLAISFIVLAWSGFALMYPGQWWARPALLWEAVPLRSAIHRIAAVVFMAVAAMHVISLMVNARLRNHWRALVPDRRDIAEAAAGLSYNLGLRKVAPIKSEHCYIEKVEYWALVWGGAVMILTGVLLWANDVVLAWLPKAVLDVATTIHLYEAILATLAVLVWHIYSVVFDPDVYPLDSAVLSGFTPRPRCAGSETAGTSKL